MKLQKTTKGTAALPNRAKSAETKHKSLFSVLHIPVAEPWPARKQPIGQSPINADRKKCRTNKAPTEGKAENPSLLADLWNNPSTSIHNGTAIKAVDITLKIIATVFIVLMYFMFFMFLEALDKSSEDKEDEGVDYFDTLSGGSYETQQRMMP